MPRGGGGLRTAARGDEKTGGAGEDYVEGVAQARGVCGSVERLAWAKASGCRWQGCTELCARR